MVKLDRRAAEHMPIKRALLSSRCQTAVFCRSSLEGAVITVLRDQLLNQLNEIYSTESAAIWARRTLPAKNTLSAVDPRRVEDAFRARLAELNDRADEPDAPVKSTTTSVAESIDKANFPIPSRAGFATAST